MRVCLSLEGRFALSFHPRAFGSTSGRSLFFLCWFVVGAYKRLAVVFLCCVSFFYQDFVCVAFLSFVRKVKRMASETTVFGLSVAVAEQLVGWTDGKAVCSSTLVGLY